MGLYDGTRVAIAGYGVEGVSAFRYFSKQGAEITICDENENAVLPPEAAHKLGPNAFVDLRDFDMVIRSPGIRPDRFADVKLTSVTRVFFELCPAPIIGITGTKGKGTTSSLIASMLKKAGKNVHLLGNIGVPALDVLDDIQPDDIVVYELSSFQLWDMRKSPQTAVVLMIDIDHLDVHKDMEEYVHAKQRIAQFQAASDTLVYHASNQYSLQIAQSSAAQDKRAFGSEQAAHVRGDSIYIDGVEAAKLSDIQLAGAHNIENVCAAISAVWRYTQDVHAIAAGIRDFNGLPHRLEFVKEINGVKYYDDSISTTPSTAVAAAVAFAEPKFMILGGSDKGHDYRELVGGLAARGVVGVVAFGQMGQVIAQLMAQTSIPYLVTSNMHEAVLWCRQSAQPGSVVLLSPAAASFDLFSSYKQRGDIFSEIVRQMK